MDYSKLRNATLVSTQDEEAVTVNTRALIDKVLARYSGEWTTLRELIQNAADASATKVSIKFETSPSSTVPLPANGDSSALLRHTILHHTLRSLKVSNNGQIFAETDWSRLKRIAEGNPDETKIGAFGVGFYSVFAECEDPFVISGPQTMAFYWKGNSLFTRRGRVPDETPTTDTCFVLDYRSDNTPVPNLMSICQFMSSSLTFVGLESIDLWLDNWNVFTLRKKSAPSIQVSIPRDIETKTKDGYMRITSVESQSAQIDASWTNVVGWVPTTVDPQLPEQDETANAAPSLRSFFSRLAGTGQSSAASKRAAREQVLAQKAILEDFTGKSSATIFIRISTVHIRTSISTNFAAELERATKKPPPKTTKIAILTSSHDEQSASLSSLQGASSQKVAEVITSVLPNKNGRIFIGFPTQQTTGLLAHISAPSLIPTVERESIDLNARYVRTWNSEILSVAGIACRIAYFGEMAFIRDRLQASRKSKGTYDQAEIDSVVPAAVHVLNQYTFREATPLPKAGSTIEEAFWTSSKTRAIEILSSQGVLPSQDVRIASEDLSFVKGIPVIPEALRSGATKFLTTIQEYGLISDITIGDISRELQKQAISEAQLAELLKWAAKNIRTEKLDTATVQSIFGNTIVNVEQADRPSAVVNDSVIALGSMTLYLNSARIPPDLPVPHNVVPYRFTKALSISDLQAFGWEELQTVPWIRWLIEPNTRKGFSVEHDMTKDAAFAGQVLAAVSKNFEGLSQSSRTTVVELLSPNTIIPTKLGMRKPVDSYFASVKLFDDLPTISGLNSVKEKLLKALGVRKTVELSVILNRLMSKEGSESAGWSHVDLIRYLASVWTDIPEQDIQQLRNTPLCPAQDEKSVEKGTAKRYKLSDLYEPKQSLKGLGLPLLQWPGTWNSYSQNEKFMRSLGLKPHPSVPELIDIMKKAHQDGKISLYDNALQYFLESHYQNNYGSFDMSDVRVPFVPIEGQDKHRIVAPGECFTDFKSTVLGFNVLRRDLHSHAAKLGVRQNPPMNECATRLISSPPADKLTARSLFSYLSTRLPDLSNPVRDRFSSAAIVPVALPRSDTGAESRKYKMVTPTSCFLGDGEEYGEIFDYVDFGEEANLFLLRVGSKHDPSIVELTQNLIRAPARILQTLQVERYLNLLRKIHLNMSKLRKDKILWREMKSSPFLLGYTETIVRHSTSSQSQGRDTLLGTNSYTDDDFDMTDKRWALHRADRVAIVNDVLLYSIFRDHLISAPQEENLEELYSSLGSALVSDLVEQDTRLGPRIGNQKSAEKMRTHILERTRLFLHEQPGPSIKHDIKWLEKNLELQEVQSVSFRRKLRGTTASHVEKRTAVITDKSTLSFTSPPEWFHVSAEIVQLVLDRPRTQSAMLLETFCTMSLYTLRARGYNVDRVLQRKEAEKARIVALEKQRAVEEEQQRQRIRAGLDREVSEHNNLSGGGGNRELQQQDHSTQPGEPKMPGSFEQTPERPLAFGSRSQAKNFFSSLKERLGFDESNSNSSHNSNAVQEINANRGLENQIQPFSNQAASPPPTSTYDPHQVRGSDNNNAVTSPASVSQNLQSAINSVKSWNHSSMFSPPRTNLVKEISTYCDAKPGANLNLVATTEEGIQVFLDKGLNDPSKFFSDNVIGIRNLGILLMDCSQVFNMNKSSLHVYYDESGDTIAFNSNGSIFCNYRFFAQLHQAGMRDPRNRAQATVWWWVVLCHELAHNLVKDHSSNHSYYTEQFVAEYFPRMMDLLTRMAGMSSGQSGPPTLQIENGVERAFS